MPIITPNMDDVKPDLTPGEYRMRITDVEAGEWSSGTPYLKFELETCGEPKENMNGRKVWHRVPYSGKGAFRFAEFHKAATGENYENGEIDTDSYRGCELLVVVNEGVNYKTGEKTGFPDVKAVKQL